MKKSLLASTLLLLGAAAFSQPRLPKDYYWEKMKNGLEVLVIENHKVPLVTIEIAVKNGSFTEDSAYNGLSHMFEHMFFKANKAYPDQETFLRRIKELGAVWNGTTGTERVNYFMTINKDSLVPGLDFINVAIRYPIYRIEDMQKERLVVDGEFQRAESSPQFQLGNALQKKMWGDLYTRKNPIGDHNIINTATPEKMMVIKNKYYFPNNSMLVICGDVTHADAFAKAEAIYGDWAPSDFDPFVKYPIPEFKPLTGTQYFTKESSIAQTPFELFGWEGPDTRNDSAGTVAADVFFTLVGLNSSKWQQALIDKGLASAAVVNYQTSRYVGPISLFVVPNPGKLKECNDEILHQIKLWSSDDYYTDEQLEDAKQSLRRDQIRQAEKPSAQAPLATYYWTSTGLEYGTDYTSNCLKITRADIRHFIDTYITGKPYIAGLIINPEMNKALKASENFKPGI